jgi:hypothetical protein
MTRRVKRTTIGGQFAPRRIDMLRSPAYCALSLSARRILDRLEIELADHGGADNGRLPVTYDDFQKYGLHRQAIYPAIRETVALGFVEITEQGVAGNAEFRKPNKFRITYRAADGVLGDGSHEWKRVGDDDAQRIAAQARREKPTQKQNLKYGSRQKSVLKPYRKRQIHSTETTTTSHSTETTTTLDISGVKARDARPSRGAVASGPLPEVRSDLLQSQIATRLGADGWSILQHVGDERVAGLVDLERRGKLDDAALVALQFAYQHRGAA